MIYKEIVAGYNVFYGSMTGIGRWGGKIMELNQLRYLVKLSEIQNFSKAAEALYITQPALLIIDTPVLDTVVVAVFTTLSVVVISVAVIGWFKRKLTLAERAVLSAAAVLMAMPHLVFNLAGAAAAGIVAGYIIFKNKNTVSS